MDVLGYEDTTMDVVTLEPVRLGSVGVTEKMV
jgi:hypothetical protein